MSEWTEHIEAAVGQTSSNAKLAVATNADTDPEQAARAVELAQASGIPSNVIYNDVESFERFHKASLANQVVSNNPHLQTYANSDPMAAKVSADDWGNLDEVSEAARKSSKPTLLDDIGDVYKGIWKGITEFGQVPESFKEIESKIHDQMVARGAPEDQIATEIQLLRARAARSQTGQNLLFALPTAIIAPAWGAYTHYVSRTAEKEFGVPREVTEGLTMAALGGLAVAHMHMMAGKEPPVGLHPIVDAVKKEQLGVDADNFKDVFNAAQKAVTKERAAELFESFVEQHKLGTISIPAEAVRRIYGDKPISPEDGKLGFVDGLAEQMAGAEPVGGDIEIPISKFVTHADPELYKELADDIRYRDQGLTKNEAKELDTQPPEGVGHIDAVRAASGLEPVLEKAAGPELTLRRRPDVEEQPSWTQAGTTTGMHNFDLVDAKGEVVGYAEMDLTKDGKILNINDIGTRRGPNFREQANTFGMKQIRALLPQLQKEFPGIEKVEGLRVSGSRFAAKGEEGIKKVTIKIPKSKAPVQGELDVTRMEDKDLFEEAKAIGMTVDRYKRYKKAVAKRQEEDLEWHRKRVEAAERKRQTREWKDNRRDLRPTVVDSLRERADFSADAFFRTGELHGERLGKRPYISGEGLSDTQRAALKDIIRENGLHPDDAARLFDYETGSALADALIELKAQRGDLQPAEFFRKAVDVETDRQMEAKYGTLSENILAEVQEHVLADTQLDIMHEETVAIGELAGAQLPISKADVKRGMAERIKGMAAKSLDPQKYLTLVGKIGRAMEDAFLRNDYAEAFRLAQSKELAFMYAQEAKKLAKQREKFDANAKRFQARTVPGVDQGYTNYIHDILLRLSKPIKRSVQDLQNSISHMGQDNLADFVAHKEQFGFIEVPVADFLLDPNWHKDFDNLTVEEFRAVHDSITTLIKNGRDEEKIFKQGEEADLNLIKAEMVQELQRFKERHYDPTGNRWLGPIPPSVAKPLRTFVAAHLQLESIFNRWDRGDPRGVFTQYVARELADAANKESRLERDYSRKLAAIKDDASLKESVPNPLFRDPLGMDVEGNGGELLSLNRGHFRSIMLNIGNKSNLDKLARGYHVQPEAVLDYVRAVATEKDWAWIQKIGAIFKEIKEEADTMYRNLSGVEPESIEIPEGGWYYPVIYHPVWEGRSVKLMGGDALEKEGYRRATTPAGYTKQRTPYAAPLALDIDMMPVRMRQMLHDIAMRPAIIQAGKIFYDPQVRAAITKHYGVEYTKLLIPYLRDVANVANQSSEAQHIAARVSEVIRQNMIATLIGLNPGTVLKHGPTAAMNSLTEVGTMNFLKAVKSLLSTDEETGQSNWSFAMEHSLELQRRHRHYNETLGGAQERVLGKESMRQWLIRMGSYPVAISDLLSAVPTWLAKYEASMREGLTHGEAISDADTAVRRAHGSSVITNRPAIARGGPVASWFSSLYGFFNHILNRQYEMAWRARDVLDDAKHGGYATAMGQVPRLTAMLFSYVIFPAIVEEAVTGQLDDKHHGFMHKAAVGLTHSLASSWIGIRDIAAGMLYGRDPSAGLISTAGKTLTDIVRDVRKPQPLGKQKAGMFIQHSATALGAATGMVNAQEGRVARYLYNVHMGVEHPRGAWSWLTGLRHGTTKGHARTGGEFLRKDLLGGR